jgi:hypothetical protein
MGRAFGWLLGPLPAVWLAWSSVADTDGDGILDGDEVPGRELLDD